MKNSYRDVKICVYAIAADEPESFIDRWLESMKGADYICVLVTKKNNTNYRYFLSKVPQYAGKLTVKEKEIKPWRFDVARNESMKLIPQDSDVLICTDIDEVLISDFWDDLRKCVYEHPNFNRIFYRYAWSHDDDNNPKWVFWYDKITQPKGWRWDYPVHEALKCDRDVYRYEGNYYLDSNKIYLHHFPDKTKSRSSYLKLLEQRANEYPDDLYGLYYLAREYSFVKKYVEAFNTAHSLYVRIKNNMKLDDMRMLPCVLKMLGEFSENLGIKEDAEYYYKKAIEAEPTLIDGYMKLAQLYAYTNRSQQCYQLLDTMREKAVRKEDWRLTTYYWREWKYNQIVADAKCWEKKYEEAASYAVKALDDLKTQDDIIDAAREGLYGDIKFIEGKTGRNLC